MRPPMCATPTRPNAAASPDMVRTQPTHQFDESYATGPEQRNVPDRDDAEHARARRSSTMRRACSARTSIWKRVLAAWHTATLRLERTHETLCGEVARLTKELEIKNRELARKNRLADLGQMASHVAHEVRNNLVPVSLYMSLLRRQAVRRLGQPGHFGQDRGRVYRPGSDRERSIKFHRPSSAAMANVSRRRPGQRSVRVARAAARSADDRRRHRRAAEHAAHGRPRNDPPGRAEPRAQRDRRDARRRHAGDHVVRQRRVASSWKSPTAARA